MRGCPKTALFVGRNMMLLLTMTMTYNDNDDIQEA